MKTSNKLLLGLIVAIFLMVAIFIGMAKYYHVPTNGGSGSNDREETSAEIGLEQNEAIIHAVLFSPVIFLQLPPQ